MVQVPAAFLTGATAINDHGQVVGAYQVSASSDYDGFLLSQGNYTTLHYPGSGDTSPFGINNTGQIVGWYDDGTTFHGFLLRDGIYSSIDFPGSTATSVLGINNADQIVGLYIDAAGNQHAFLATPVPEASTLLSLLLSTALAMCLMWWRSARQPPTSGISPPCRFEVTGPGLLQR